MSGRRATTILKAGPEAGQPAERPSPSPDRALSFLITAVIGGGCAVMLSAFTDISGLTHPPALWKLAVAALAFFVGDMAILHLRFGHNQHSFTWSETAVVMGLVLLPSPWLRLIAPLSVVAAHVWARRPAVKVAFNAGSSAIGCGAARAAFMVVATGAASPTSPRTWLALAAGSCAFWLVNGLTVSGAVALSQGLSVRSVYAKGLALNGVVWLGNTSTGVILVALGATQPGMLLLLPILIALLWLGYRGYLRAMQERDVWEVLQATSRDLIRPNQTDVAAVAMERAEALFRAEFVELMLADSEPGTTATVFRRQPGGETERADAPIAVAGTFWPRVLCEREPFELLTTSAAAAQRRELETLGLAMCIVAPLIAQDGCLGTLRIGFRGSVKLAGRELQVLSTFANHVSTSLHNARLFEAMNKERAKLSGVLDHSSDGILGVDSEGCVSSWNPAMVKITGIPSDIAIGLPLSDALAATTESGEVMSWEGLLQDLSHGPQLEVAVAVRNPESGRRWLDLSVSGVPRQSATDDAAVIVARDVTAARELEETQQDFVATVSHELRTPLTPLKGFLGTMLRPDFDFSSVDARDIHTRMLGQVHRLERLVEDLLTTSQVDRGQFQVSAAVLAVDDLVEKVLQDYGRQCSFRRGGVDAVAVADAGRVEQILGNLLSNADKYSPSDAPVGVSVERVVHENSDEVWVRVSDGGSGIPKNQQDAVFERFRRLGDHMTRRRGGSGLGLYISRRLVEAMGGRIWVEDPRVGEGATFVFALPAAAAAPVRAPLKAVADVEVLAV